MFGLDVCNRVHTIAGFIETMLRIAMRREDGDFVSAILQSYCSVNNETLRPTNAEIWVEKGDILRLGRPLHIAVVFVWTVLGRNHGSFSSMSKERHVHSQPFKVACT